MKISILFKGLLITGLIYFYSCSHKDERPQTAIDTGRDFIRASLDGDFKAAEKLILQDTQNQQLFDSYKRYYSRLPAEQKTKYREASYEINKLTDVNDSATVINFSNSYMKRPMEIKVIKFNKEWFVDFKYTYADQTDSLNETHNLP